jgi:hypothetical protein
MKMEGGRPQIGNGGYFLGVRIGSADNDDINPDENGFVQPGQGGMSVSSSLDALPSHRLPRRLREKYPQRIPDARAPNSVHCWHMGNGDFASGPLVDGLCLRLDPDMPNTHAFVEPDGRMHLKDYEAALANTQGQWQKWEE